MKRHAADELYLGLVKPAQRSRRIPSQFSFSSHDEQSDFDDPIPSSSKVNERDEYCWSCHEAHTTVDCTTCFRAYHPKCIQIGSITDRDWRCEQCLHIENAKLKWEKRQFDENMLTYATKRLVYNEKFKKFRNAAKGVLNSMAAKLFTIPMDLNKIHEKAKNKVYVVPEEILLDIQMIQHNCLILFPENSKENKAAVELIEICEQEVNLMTACPECYVELCTNRKQWFVRVCKQPHLLIWAKIYKYPYWPAKVMSIQGDQINVQFFDDHTTSKIVAEECFLLSKEYPNNSTGSRPKTTDKAIKECEEHIERIRKKFGSFEYATKRVPLDISKINKHLQTMIPTLQIDKTSHENDSSETANEEIPKKNLSKRKATENKEMNFRYAVVRLERLSMQQIMASKVTSQERNGENVSSQSEQNNNEQSCEPTEIKKQKLVDRTNKQNDNNQSKNSKRKRKTLSKSKTKNKAIQKSDAKRSKIETPIQNENKPSSTNAKISVNNADNIPAISSGYMFTRSKKNEKTQTKTNDNEPKTDQINVQPMEIMYNGNQTDASPSSSFNEMELKPNFVALNDDVDSVMMDPDAERENGNDSDDDEVVLIAEEDPLRIEDKYYL